MKVLFIGNSYTFFNDMPKLLENLAKENGRDFTQESITKGGRRLHQNLVDGDENSEKIKLLAKENEYDALFLQEHSCLSILDYDKFLFAIKTLRELVGAKRTILYATWGRKSGSPKLEELSLTSEEMTKKLTKAYVSAASETNSEISHVGLAFFKILNSKPELELYNNDLSHPSYLGSVVAAICHYNALFGEMPKATESFGVEKETVDELIALILEAQNEI